MQNPQRPIILQNYPIVYPHVTFNATQIAPYLNFTTPTILQKHTRENTHRSCYVNYAMTSGLHYFQFQLNDGGPSRFIMIGIAKSGMPLSSSTYPGYDSNGFGYYCHNGHRYHCGNANGYSITSNTGDTVGMLVDLDSRTISYFVNGKPIGAAFGASEIPAGQTWYPVVSLYEMSTVEIQHL